MGKLSFDELTYLFLLQSIDRIGPVKIKNLLTKFKNLSNIFSSNINQLIEAEGINKELATRIRKSLEGINSIKIFLDKELEALNKLGANIITIWDDDYPQLLKNIFDPPLILYTIGNFDEKDKYSIAVVGTRQPTNYGKIQAEKITAELVEQNITIVSGLARGIDSISHSTVTKNNGRTIAVIGSGLDVIYPAENKKLFYQIAESGIVLSEFKLGTIPNAENFPKRNRIISGLSLGTLVVETAINGGAMQTARLALDQNREVFAVPGNLGIRQSEGTNFLIQRGEAKLIKNAEDILVELELKLKPIIGKNIPKHQNDLTIFEEKIYNCLITEPLHIDKISEITDLSTSDCLVNLLSLEFKGLIKQLPGKMFMLI